MPVIKHDTDTTLDMSDNAKYFYDEGQTANKKDNNPYNRKSQVMAFHCWSAGYCDKWGYLPREV
jgi:hypothetical protein